MAFQGLWTNLFLTPFFSKPTTTVTQDFFVL